jgi:hypothetical protein
LRLNLRVDVAIERRDPLPIDGHVTLHHRRDFYDRAPRWRRRLCVPACSNERNGKATDAFQDQGPSDLPTSPECARTSIGRSSILRDGARGIRKETLVQLSRIVCCRGSRLLFATRARLPSQSQPLVGTAIR